MLLLWVAITYFISSIPFSVLIGRVLLGVNIREYGDGNPGATNVLRASGNVPLFVISFLLDGFKSLIPVAIAHWLVGITGYDIVLVALAGIIGHSFSLFLGFSGGKAIAATFGVWAALTVWEAPTFMGLLLLYWYKSVEESNWAVILMLLSFLLYLLLTINDSSLLQRADNHLLLLWAGTFAILLFKHRDGLGQLPTPKYWLPFIRKPQQA